MFERPESWLFAAGIALGWLIGYITMYVVNGELIERKNAEIKILKKSVDHYKSMLVLTQQQANKIKAHFKYYKE